MKGYFLDELNSENFRDIFNQQIDDELKINTLLDKEALAKLGLKSAIVYCYDKIITDSIANLNLDMPNIQEIRIFNELIELRIWKEDELLKGSIFKELNSGAMPIQEGYILYPRGTGGADPDKLIVKKYIDYDADGQAYIAYVKPSAFKGGGI